MEFVYKFPVVKGIQAKKDYYIAMVPMKMLVKLFPSDEEYVSPEYRAQRKLNESRIPIISKYIVDNRDTYVFSALAASIDGNFTYCPSSDNPNVGVLEVEMDAKFLLNDGQHRKSAILNALLEDPSLGEETISVVLFADKGLERSQQIFTDLNKNAVRTSNSISELYDSRDPLAVATRNVVRNIEFFNKYIYKEKDNLCKYSSILFTLKSFYVANKIIVGKHLEAGAEGFLLHFWSAVANNMVPWIELEEKQITKISLRENYIATQNVVIQALGRVGNQFYLDGEYDIDEIMKLLKNVNWERAAKEWYLRAIGTNGRIITNKKASILISNVIKKTLGLELSNEEQRVENEFKKQISE